MKEETCPLCPKLRLQHFSVSAVKLDTLIQGCMGRTDLLLQPASSGHLRNCSHCHKEHLCSMRAILSPRHIFKNSIIYIGILFKKNLKICIFSYFTITYCTAARKLNFASLVDEINQRVVGKHSREFIKSLLSH